MLSIDLHVHSIMSGHALNTVNELINMSKSKGMTHIGITDHGPAMEGAPHEDYFWISDQLTSIKDIKVFLGIELNILNKHGEVDLNDELLSKQEIVSAGIHLKTPYDEKGVVSNTESLINAIHNPLIKIITHPYRPEFPVDIKKVVEACYQTSTLLEVNNNLFSRNWQLPELKEQYSLLITLCKKYDMPVILGSDAHTAEKIGNIDNLHKVQEHIGLCDEIIINNNLPLLLDFLSK